MAEIPLRKWPGRFPQPYERSFNGKSWAPCSRLDIRNSFLALKEILRELDAGKIVVSANGVSYRRKKTMG